MFNPSPEAPLRIIAILLLCSLAFAEPSDSTVKDSVSKNSLLINIGALNFLETSLIFESEYKENNDYTLRYGPGLGIQLEDIGYSYFYFPIFFNAHLEFPKDDFEFFINNRLGMHIYGSYYDDYEDVSCFLLCDVFYEPSVGVQLGNFNFSLGYYISSVFENSFVLRAGYRHHYEANVKKDSDEVPKEKEKEESSSRWFRLGLEANYPVWRSRIEFFDNAFPFAAIGAGLFLRIGPESFYFTSGAYAKIEEFRKEGALSADMNVFGLTIASLPLLDIIWDKASIEVPLLINFGSGQIRFTGGALLEFSASNYFDISVNDSVPVLGGKSIREIIGESNADKLNEQFDKTPEGNFYWVLGLDFDIVRHWGIGVKYMIWAGSWGTSEDILDTVEKIYEPAHFQTRVSTYFVF